MILVQRKKSSLGLDNAFSEKKNSIDFCDACLERKSSKVGYSIEPSGESGNTSSEKKKRNVGIVQCILYSVKSNDCVSSTKQISSTTELPDHLRDLYNRSTADLTTQESKQLYDLLLEFADVLSESPHDLGRTDLVKHQINTNGANPIRQPPQR